ncbi:Glucosamine-6-phosphate deaminase, partial [hydrothermal vent metagenome]
SSYGSSYDLNIQMFNTIQRTITGWPGGKPNADDSQRPERANPPQKRTIIFSPHPDDDVISMGGTFIRLHDQGHEVHVAYQTSGNIAVFDEEVVKYANFYSELKSLNDSRNEKPDSFYKNIQNAVLNKKPGDIDTAEVRNIKGLIRRGEARAACRFVGIPDERAHFLDLPFYETGKVKKNQVGAEDLKITVDILRKIKPHQIFTAGDLSDPHGTHRVCLELIFQAIEVLKNEDWMKDCYVWLYRGAWHEWGIEDIDMVVPLSPDQLLKKRKAIFNHQSQKDNVVFQGSDNRQFWQRAEDRNRNTASQYNQLGLSEYEAMEAFKRYYF